MAQTVLVQVIILSLMILLGFILGKIGFIKKSHSDFMTDLVMDVFFPCNILAAAGNGLGDEQNGMKIALFIIVFYFVMLVVFTVLGYILGGLAGFSEDQRRAFACSAGYPNNGFMGIPLCSAVFGTRGVLWSSFGVPGATFYIFAVLAPLFQRSRSENMKERLRSLLTPLNISVVIMILMLISGWKLDGPLLSALKSMGACNTPAAMLLIGYLLSASPILDTLRRPAVYLVTLCRNLIFPLLCALLLSLTALNREMCLCITMQIGCSVGATVSIFATRYDRAPEFSSESMLQSTLLLPLTMPIMMFLAEKILTQ